MFTPRPEHPSSRPAEGGLGPCQAERPRPCALLLRAMFLISLLTFAPPASSQAPRAAANQKLPQGVEVQVRPEPQKCTVGDPIRIDFDILIPKGFSARIPPPGNKVGEFEILEFHPGPEPPQTESQGRVESSRETGAEGSLHHRARVVAALYNVGQFEFPPLPLVLTDEKGKEITTATPAFKIEVQSVLSENDQELKDLKKQAEIEAPVRWMLWLALLLGLLLLAGLVWWWLRRNRRAGVQVSPQPLLDPLALAEAELRDLLARGLLEKRLVKEFYVALSDIAKKVLEAGYDVQTLEKTSGEILESLRDTDRAGTPIDLPRIESLLTGCDLVKFAKYVPSRSENEAAIQRTREILETCKKIRPAPEAAPTAP